MSWCFNSKCITTDKSFIISYHILGHGILMFILAKGCLVVLIDIKNFNIYDTLWQNILSKISIRKYMVISTFKLHLTTVVASEMTWVNIYSLYVYLCLKQTVH